MLSFSYTCKQLASAIAKNEQISFQYFDYDLKKQRRYFKKGERYTASPWAMIYTDDNYQCIWISKTVLSIASVISLIC